METCFSAAEAPFNPLHSFFFKTWFHLSNLVFFPLKAGRRPLSTSCGRENGFSLTLLIHWRRWRSVPSPWFHYSWWSHSNPKRPISWEGKLNYSGHSRRSDPFHYLQSNLFILFFINGPREEDRYLGTAYRRHFFNQWVLIYQSKSNIRGKNSS